MPKILDETVRRLSLRGVPKQSQWPIVVAVLLLLPTATVAQSGAQGIAGGGTATSRSGTATGSAVTAVPINPGRVGCELQNLGPGDLYFALGQTAVTAGVGSYWLAARDAWTCPQPAPTGAISVIAPSGTNYTIMEYAR